MKKTILLALSLAVMATAVLSSCKKDSDTVTFRATISDLNSPASNSKTHIEVLTQEGANDEYWVYWNNNDTVMINGAEHTVALSNNNASIAGVPVNEDGGYYAFYPASRATAGTAGAAAWPTQILLPQVQNYRAENGHQVIEAPMAAYCPNSQTNPSLNFKNLCALLKIQLTEAMEVAYITVGSSNKPLWGVATISGTTEPVLSEPSISPLSATDKTVTLDFTDNGLHGSDGDHQTTSSSAASGVTSAGPFYIVLPPATDVADLTINIYVFNGNNASQSRRTVLKYTKTATASISIAANDLYTTGSLPESGVEVPDVPYPNLGTGEFSVSGSKKVRFALGNLQYQASTGLWRFASDQWTYIGNAAGNTTSSSRSTQTAWIDLFGYGTSGVTYDPTQYGGSGSYASGNIYNTTNDWGVNPISNGGNQPNKWRTLSRDEFSYLLNDRISLTTANKLHIPSVTLFNGYKGTIILPDNYKDSLTEGSILNRTGWWDDLNGNTVSQDDWNRLAKGGAVFLPLCGVRSGKNTTVSYVSNTRQGWYWTSQWSNYNSKPYIVSFNTGGESFWDTHPASYGCAVRLVRDVN